MALALKNLLCCPYCHGELSEIQESFLCQWCSKIFPLINGIPSFTNQTDRFYEGRFASTRRIFTNPVTGLLYNVYTSVSIDSSLEWFLKRVFKNKKVLITIGENK